MAESSSGSGTGAPGFLWKGGEVDGGGQCNGVNPGFPPSLYVHEYLPLLDPGRDLAWPFASEFMLSLPDPAAWIS